MAADTREQKTDSSKSSSQDKLSDTSVTPVAPPNANALPAGAGLNTAGGKAQEAGIVDALRSIRPTEFTEVHKKPCARDALLTGIGGGFGVGGIRAILGGKFLAAIHCCQSRADIRSHRLDQLQLGCRFVLGRLFLNARILPKEAITRDARHEESGGGNRPEAGREAEKDRRGQSSEEESQGGRGCTFMTKDAGDHEEPVLIPIDKKPAKSGTSRSLDVIPWTLARCPRRQACNLRCASWLAKFDARRP